MPGAWPGTKPTPPRSVQPQRIHGCVRERRTEEVAPRPAKTVGARARAGLTFDAAPAVPSATTPATSASYPARIPSTLRQALGEVADNIEGEADVRLRCLHRADLEAEGKATIDAGLCQV